MKKAIRSVRQTPRVKRAEGGLFCELRAVIDSPCAEEGSLFSDGTPVWSGTLAAGENTVLFYLPEPEDEKTENLSLAGGNDVSITVHPAKRWEVHVVQLSHHDPGYTDVPSHVLEESSRFLSAALDDMDAREDYPEDARYRIVIEQAYSLCRFLDTASEYDRERMLSRIRRGDIEVTAFYANLISELLSPEEMLRAMYPSERIAREAGVPLVSAEHNDIPGFSWGYCTALCRAGIRFFAPGLPEYYSWSGEGLSSFWDRRAIFGGDIPGAFYWESQEGDRILFWSNNAGCGGSPDPGMPALLSSLEALEDANSPLTVFRLPVQGADRDNSPYSPAFSDAIRAWNETYVTPHLISSTESKFYDAFTKQKNFTLPVFRGGVDGQDYPVASTSQMTSSALNRENHMLFRSAELLCSAVSDDPVLSDGKERLSSAVLDMLMADEHAFGFTFPACPGQRASFCEHGVYASRANADFHDILAKSMASVSDRVGGDFEGYRLTVFGTSGKAGKHVVTAPLRDPDNCGTEIRPGNRTGVPRIYELGNRMQTHPQGGYLEGNFRLTDLSTGENVPYTLRDIPWDDPTPLAAARAGIGTGTRRFGMFEDPRGIKKEIRFVSDLPSCGYKTFALIPCDEPAYIPQKPAEDVIENEYYRVSFDKTGITDIRDADGASLFDPACPYAPLSLLVRNGNGPEVSPGTLLSVYAETGATGSFVTVKGNADGVYEYTMRVSLDRGVNAVNLSLRVVKSEKPLQTLFFCFPFAGTGVSYQSAFSEGKPTENLLPGSHSDAIAVQDYVKTEGTDILWSSRNAPVVHLSHLREGYVSPAHRCIADSKKRVPLSEKDYDTGWIFSLLTCNNFGTNFFPTQLSDACFSYVFAKNADSAPAAWGLDAQSPVTTILTDRSRGTLPVSGEILSVPGLRVLALKQAENGNGLILRVRNDGVRDITSELSLWGRPAELLSVCDALEHDLAPLSGNTVTVKPGTLAAFRLKKA